MLRKTPNHPYSGCLQLTYTTFLTWVSECLPSIHDPSLTTKKPMEPPKKRARLEDDEALPGSLLPASLTRPISPVGRRSEARESPAAPSARTTGSKLVRSPFQLTAIRDLPAASNVDSVSLKDILGDPLIAECWEFNYLHDLDFLMNAFDEDVRGLVRVHVVHGFWKKEDPSRRRLEVKF